MNYPFATLVFYGSYLVFPFLIFLGVLCYKKKKLTWPLAVLIIVGLVFIYSRFVERYWIVIHHETVVFSGQQAKTTLKAAVLSDLHLGIYKSKDFLQKVVQKVNEQNPDLVLIAGDFTHDITVEQFSYFGPLKDIKAPIYAVAGNHDSLHPGEFSSDQIHGFLSPYNVKFIDNDQVELTFGADKNNAKLKIFGLSDLWEGKTNFSFLKNVSQEENTVILVHNPDAAYELPNNYADVLVAGHTHGGQIRIPILYKLVIPTIHPFDKGFSEVNGLKVYITSGLGEIGLPLRFLIPPEITMLDFKI